MKDHRRLLELFWEFEAHITELHTLYLDSLVGYSLLYERVLGYRQSVKDLLGGSDVSTDEFQDTCSILYKSVSACDYAPFSMSPVMKQGDLRRRVSEDGKNTTLLGQQCLVAAYSYWEEYMRVEIGKAIGVLPATAKASDATRRVLNKTVTSDFWGDVRYFRNSIVHNKGMANSEVRKCRVLKWFKPGQPIDLPHERMRSIFLLMARSRNALHDLSLPKRRLRIPITGAVR